jgi:demethylmenaquinone methyltransferase/2-methoxy-6-polyprenyl-1,4-benzoquinol methylase
MMSNGDKSLADARANREMFAEIASRYELMNRLMTAGLDAGWRRELIAHAGLHPGARVLDIGAGTGDIAGAILNACPSCTAIAADYTFEMMQTGKQKRHTLLWSSADALNLPFADGEFDAVVSGFLLRNVTNLDRALREQWRVLKAGGRWGALDTTRPEKNVLSPFIQFHLQTVIPTLGRIITGNEGAYRYLTASTAGFLSAEEVSERARQAGFQAVSFARRNLGTIAIHWGVKE